jgi:hypothetical protein
MSKCIKCNLKKIDRIVFYSLTVQKCKACKYVRLFLEDFDLIVYETLLQKNIGNIKKYNDVFECNQYEKRLIDDFLEIFKHKIELDNKLEEICDVCHEQLKQFSLLNKFNFYYCDYCKSIYFKQDDYENFINFIIKYIERKNLRFKIYFTIKSKIRFRLLKIKEIFHRKVKNNVKK